MSPAGTSRWRRHGHDSWRARTPIRALPMFSASAGRRMWSHIAEAVVTCSATGATAPIAACAAQIHIERGSRPRCLPGRSRKARRQGARSARPFRFTSTGDCYGWTKGDDGLSHLTLFVAKTVACATAGPGAQQLTAIRRIAELNFGDIRLTPKPEHHCRQRPGRPPGRDYAQRRGSWPAAAAVGTATQFDGLRRPADLRARARGE